MWEHTSFQGCLSQMSSFLEEREIKLFDPMASQLPMLLFFENVLF